MQMEENLKPVKNMLNFRCFKQKQKATFEKKIGVTKVNEMKTKK